MGHHCGCGIAIWGENWKHFTAWDVQFSDDHLLASVINYIMLQYSLARIMDTCGALPAAFDVTLVAEAGVLSPIVFIPD